MSKEIPMFPSTNSKIQFRFQNYPLDKNLTLSDFESYNITYQNYKQKLLKSIENNESHFIINHKLNVNQPISQDKKFKNKHNHENNYEKRAIYNLLYELNEKKYIITLANTYNYNCTVNQDEFYINDFVAIINLC
jgi:hypothetical protein